MTSNITLILGGARSGKSSFAEGLALGAGLPVTYLATADVRDGEMARRVEIHRQRRLAGWSTWEEPPRELPEAVASASGVLLLDCLTLWLTRLFLEADAASLSEEEWASREKDIRSLTKRLCRSPRPGAHLLIVSNEVGFGLVPPSVMGRRFRDLQGRMNQLTVRMARRVALVVAGCPLWVKGTGEDNGKCVVI